VARYLEVANMTGFVIDEVRKFECVAQGLAVSGLVEALSSLETNDYLVDLEIDSKKYSFAMRRQFVQPEKYTIAWVAHVTNDGKRSFIPSSFLTTQSARIPENAFEFGIDACVAWHQALNQVKTKILRMD
jgi:hypothetical protein